MNNKLATLIAAVVTAGAVAAAAPAYADSSETAFLETLTAFGMRIYDAQQALVTGYQLCNEMTTDTGTNVAAALYRRTGSEVPNIDAADEWVIASAMNLCPWEYHPNS
jgi:hypothetical protein